METTADTYWESVRKAEHQLLPFFRIFEAMQEDILLGREREIIAGQTANCDIARNDLILSFCNRYALRTFPHHVQVLQLKKSGFLHHYHCHHHNHLHAYPCLGARFQTRTPG